MRKAPVPDNISEEYYQISPTILESFPKYRPPLDLFRLDETIIQLLPYFRKGDRLSNEQVEEVHTLCNNGNLFVARSDHHIYSKHIFKQLDLVLVDQNLKEAEVADICIAALDARLNEFFAQPVKPVFDLLYEDLMVVTEYIWQDKHRLKLFVRRLWRGEYSLSRHSVNCFSLGLWLLAESKGDELRRKEFDQAAAALLLHDVGMSKVPMFITGKTTPLKPDEKEKIPPHTLMGYKIMHKLDQAFDAMHQATLEHHERLDGSGYPQHSKTQSSFGRLTAVVDAFSAMLQSRPYGEAKAPEVAARELSADRTRFDSGWTGKILSAIITGSIGPFKDQG